MRIKDAALVAATVLANRYISDRFLPDKAIDLVDEAAAKEHLVWAGYDAAYGARPLKRVIQKEVETALGRRLLKGEVRDGQTVVVDHDPARGELTFRAQAKAEAAEPAAAAI